MYAEAISCPKSTSDDTDDANYDGNCCVVQRLRYSDAGELILRHIYLFYLLPAVFSQSSTNIYYRKVLLLLELTHAYNPYEEANV